MTNSLVFQGEQITVNAEQLETIKLAITKQSPTEAELKLYFYDCDRRGVHPLDKLIHFSKRDGRYVPIVSIDYMRMRAESSGSYAGSDDAVFVINEKYPPSASVTVWKIVGNTRCPFTATARWAEYAPYDINDKSAFMWRKMPYTMLAKCAEALALRKAFPGQLQGLYSNEEMNQAGHNVIVQDSPITVNEVTGEIVYEQPKQEQKKPATAKPAASRESTGKIPNAADDEMIATNGSWAVAYAAKAWNMSAGDAAVQIAKKNLGKQIKKSDFIKFVEG